MHSNLRILLVNLLEIYGGGEYFMQRLAHLLRNNGHQPYVFCLEGSTLHLKCEKDRIEFFPARFNQKSVSILEKIRILKRYISDKRIQIVHTSTDKDRTPGAFAAKQAGCNHITNVFSLQSVQHNITHWYRNRFLTDKFITNGNCVRDLLIRNNSIPSNKISVIHQGIDTEKYRKNQTDRENIRKELGIRDDQIAIGNAARMVEFKGHELILKSLRMVREKYPEIKLVLVGDGELRSKIESVTTEFGLAENVIFTGFRNDLDKIFSAFDIYVHTSLPGGAEVLPYTCLYAMSFNLPLIITNTGDMSALIQNEKNGYLLNDTQPDNLAVKLDNLVKNKSIRQAMGNESRKIVTGFFTEERMIDEILYIYTIEFPFKW